MNRTEGLSKGFQKTYKLDVLSPEVIEQNVFYTFSFNPKVQPVRHKAGFKCSAFTEWQNDVLRTFRKSTNAMYDLNLELSRAGRLHYHGKIKILNIINFYIQDLPHLADEGVIEIDTIKDSEVWEKYCHKQELLMKPFCQIHGLIYNYTELNNEDQ